MTGMLLPRRGALLAGAGLLAAPSVHAQSLNRDRVILAMTQEPVQFNPLLYVNAGTENVPEACLFDALWDVDDKGAFIPNLAAQVPSRANGGISADGLTWRVQLKRDVKWSDGQPFTAKDVEFTYRTIMNPAVAVRSRSGFDLIKTFRVTDDLNIEMELSKPFVPFLWAWQNMHIVPMHILGREASVQTAAFNSAPIGTGPYLLRSRTAGSHMVYERNPNYHRGAPRIRQSSINSCRTSRSPMARPAPGRWTTSPSAACRPTAGRKPAPCPTATSSPTPAPTCSSSTTIAASPNSPIPRCAAP